MRRLIRPSKALLFLVPFLGRGAYPLPAQEIEPPSAEAMEAARSAPLFASHAPLSLTLEADLNALVREDRSQDSREERPGVMRWTNEDGSSDSLAIQVRTRGNFRLQRRNCDFPPLRINVPKKATKGTLFDGEDKLKLVVACKLGQDYWEQYVLLEYMAYRTLNVLTDASFRARLARVDFVDSSGKTDPFTRYAFFIEDVDMLAVRNNAMRIEWSAGQLHPALVDKHQAVLVDVFQYMIGNTDWSGVEMHNMEVLRTFDNVYLTVPYDFDFSGLVNARYATPDPSLRISRVRQRLFRGFCPADVGRSQEDYDAIYAHFLEKKDEIYGMWRNQEGLKKDRLEDNLEYFDEFYKTLSDPGRIDRNMIRDCRRVGD